MTIVRLLPSEGWDVPDRADEGPFPAPCLGKKLAGTCPASFETWERNEPQYFLSSPTSFPCTRTRSGPKMRVS